MPDLGGGHDRGVVDHGPTGVLCHGPYHSTQDLGWALLVAQTVGDAGREAGAPELFAIRCPRLGDAVGVEHHDIADGQVDVRLLGANES
jgi:hypothetical protein